nr:(-)-germacrene D synthase-like [Coffea arabica]
MILISLQETYSHYLFLKDNFSEEEGELQRLEDEVRKMLTETPDESPGKLDLIDTIRRLGVSYHFESEIEGSLQNIYNACDEMNNKDANDLHTIALRFRLLRQQGFYASSDVFDNFKNPEGDFKESLASNVQGMLSLYEAANFGVHGENVLEEALKFSMSNLESMIPNLSNFLAAQVVQALKVPIQKSLTRIAARQYISFYQQDESHDKLLLKFAKLDFNILQKLHQKELGCLTAWWKNLDLATNTPFARDRLVECYYWILGVYFEPKYCLARTILTKVISITSIIDDIYDVYGTIDELTIFTDAIERWNIHELDQLPSYMRHCYRALLDTYTDYEEELGKEAKSERLTYAKLEMKKLVKAYFEEAKWFHNGYVPRVEEYMKVALVTGAYMMLATTSMVGMGDSVTTHAFDWITNEPLIVRAASVICRLMDDMAGHEFEQERGHVASAVECYVNEYGVTKQEAFDELNRQTAKAWKDINGECLNSNAVPMEALQRVLNLAKVICLIYKDEDGYTHSATVLKDYISLMLVDPVPT